MIARAHAALALPVVCLFASCSQDAPAPVQGPRFGFVDVSAEAGVHFEHSNGATGKHHFPESTCGGAAWLDFDRDGHLDLFFVQSGSLPGEPDITTTGNTLLRNRGDGTFEDVSAASADAQHTGYGQGVTVGDYDGDGWVDLYVTAYGRNTLLRNVGDGAFEDVTGAAGVGDDQWGASCVFFDMEGDGDLDLYVVNYVEYGPEDFKRLTGREEGLVAYPSPDRFRSQPDVLYRNEGDGTFRDVTLAAGIHDVEGKGLGVVASDLDGDGDADLYVANDGTPNFLFENQGDGTFADVTLMSGTGYNAHGQTEAGMGIAVGDVNGDLKPDVFVTHMDVETNTLYINRGGLVFADETMARGVAVASRSMVGFGTGFLDADTDGDLDLIVANGHIMDNIGDIMPGSGIDYRQPMSLFENDGHGGFVAVQDLPAGLRVPRVIRAAAFADYDNDGDLDVALAQSNDSAVLLRNDSARHGRFLSILPVDDEGRTSLGVRVLVRAGDLTLLAQSVPGASYCAANDPRILVGLPEADTCDLEVHWPTGEMATYQGVQLDSFVRVSPTRIETILN